MKNLNFKIIDESLRKYFSENMKEGKILSVRVRIWDFFIGRMFLMVVFVYKILMVIFR